METKVTSQNGFGAKGRIYFESRLPTFGSESDVKELAKQGQASLGYDHRGYDGPWNVQLEVLNEGGYLLTWCCAASCD